MKTLWNNLQYALYCASIIIGAGVLTMALTGPRLGFVPHMVITVLVGLLLMAIYSRLSHTIFTHIATIAREKTRIIAGPLKWGAGIKTDETEWKRSYGQQMIKVEAQKGSYVFHEVVRRTGIGSAGLWTLLVGMFLYVYFADIGYILLGNRSLSSVAEMIRVYGGRGIQFFLVFGIVLFLISLTMPRWVHRMSARLGAIRKFMMMAGWWSLGIGILAVSNVSNTTLSSMLFLIAIGSAMYTTGGTSDSRRYKDGLNAQHRTNVGVMIFELGLLLTASVLIVAMFFHKGLIQPFFAFDSGWLNTSHIPNWTRVIGVALFAFTGTGIFNLCSYPQLFEPDSSLLGKANIRTVVVLGTLIPLLVYLIWTMVSALTLSPEELTQGDTKNEYTMILIATKTVDFIPAAAPWITLAGYLFALMAVTSACNGFTESLSDEIRHTLKDLGRLKAAQFDYRPVILIVAALGAIMKDLLKQAIDISDILSVAGHAGGGLLLVILPFFFPYPLYRRTRARYWEIGVVFVVTAFLCYSIVNDAGDGPIAWIKWGVALLVGGMAFWLLFSEPKEPEPVSLPTEKESETILPPQSTGNIARVSKSRKSNSAMPLVKGTEVVS